MAKRLYITNLPAAKTTARSPAAAVCCACAANPLLELVVDDSAAESELEGAVEVESVIDVVLDSLDDRVVVVVVEVRLG